MVLFICISLVMIALPTLLWIKGTKTFTKLGAILALALLTWGSYKLLEIGTLPPDARMSNGNPIVVLLPFAVLSSVAYGCVLITAVGRTRLTRKSLRMAAGGAFLALLLLDVLLIQRTTGGYRFNGIARRKSGHRSFRSI
ncbi:hypothetical protein J31TS4_03310 [Paenibacillus sp. J31TS4]|uniref:hypothetical protein n=1 Tax=Paenibacillus sp. J31TS4 TaxID=2807195 RepID=UPI001B2D9764|nr:hypothetical protein [Paenibacillus sp. J31TS4]GIP37051.1 hypothetical protein J31TS4_03310 [Paenibacillus sp. J31TS4]